jgi:8-oxo-dGTP pyrophosphatase MutT (NUDIX family)
MIYNRSKCLNCDVYGHSFKNCNEPVKSYGIIAYKESEGINKFLLIQRKDTIGKIDFIRGKYKTNGKIDYSWLRNLIQEMTDEEKNEILRTKKEDLWNNLWLDHKTSIYKNGKLKSLKAFEELDYRELLLDSGESRYKSNEWGFPKGRRNLKESGFECAIREFQEETGLSTEDFFLCETDKVFIEDFIASDNKKYSHVYFLAKVKSDIEVKMCYKNDVFNQEVNDIGFFDFKKAYKMFRDYDTEKKHVLSQVNKYLLQFKEVLF